MHRDFDASRRAYDVERDPVTFTLGGELFTVNLEPSLGDTFDLYDAPEIRVDESGEIIYDNSNAQDIQLVRILSRFLERSLPLEERPRFQQALYRIPATQGHVILEAAVYIVEQITAFPSEPPAN